MSLNSKRLLLCLVSILMLALPSPAQTMKDTLTVYFRKGSSEFDADYRDNRKRYDDFVKRIRAIQNETHLTICGVDFRATASPEGTTSYNERLAQRRINELTRHLRHDLHFADSIVTLKTVVEDWDGLVRLIKDDTDVPDKTRLLQILENDIDGREQRLFHSAEGLPWKRLMYGRWLPQLRRFDIYVYIGVMEPELEEPVIDDSLFTEIPNVPHEAVTMCQDTLSAAVLPMPPTGPKKEIRLKTNTFGWALIGANIAAEFDIIPHLSVSVPFYYSGGLDYFTTTIQFRGIVLQPELRYWPWLKDGRNGGFYVGAHLGLGWYNIALNGKYRIQDRNGNRPSWGGGLGLGYSIQFKKNPRWGMEFSLGAGVYDSCYDMFYNESEGPFFRRDVHKTWFGIDNAAVSFTYRFPVDTKKKEVKR